MYNDLFDNNRQTKMRSYFLYLGQNIGKIKCYKKNELINSDMNNSVGIVMKGVLSQSIISSKGHVHSLYLLRKGEIMGESFYFCGGKNNISTLVKEDAKVSFLLKDELENELKNNPEGYRYFIHSLTRKYRIVTLQLTCNLFNDSLGKIADALLRLSSCAEVDSLGRINLNMKFSHQELANIIGCSRITVTNCLNKLLKEKIISYENKNIIINKPEDLKKYIDLIVD